METDRINLMASALMCALTDDQETAAKSAIESLPQDTFISVKECQRTQDESSRNYMEPHEVYFRYSPYPSEMRVEGPTHKKSLESIGAINTPDGAKNVKIRPWGVTFDFRETSYSVKVDY